MQIPDQNQDSLYDQLIIFQSFIPVLLEERSKCFGENIPEGSVDKGCLITLPKKKKFTKLKKLNVFVPASVTEFAGRSSLLPCPLATLPG